MKLLIFCLFMLSYSVFAQSVSYLGIKEISGLFYMVHTQDDKGLFIYSKIKIPTSRFKYKNYEINNEEVYLLGLHTDVWYFLNRSGFSKEHNKKLFTKTIDSLLFDYLNYGFNFSKHSIVDSFERKTISYKAYSVEKEKVLLFDAEVQFMKSLFNVTLSSADIKAKHSNIKVGIVFNNESDFEKIVNAFEL